MRDPKRLEAPLSVADLCLLLIRRSNENAVGLAPRGIRLGRHFRRGHDTKGCQCSHFTRRMNPLPDVAGARRRIERSWPKRFPSCTTDHVVC